MIILGIDPGSRTTGMAVIESRKDGIRVIQMGYWRPSCHRWSCRIGELFESIEGWLQTYLPDAVVMEEVFIHPAHPRSGMVLQQITGAIEAALAHHGYSWVTYPTTVIKQAITGSGRANKLTLRRRLRLLIPDLDSLNGYPADAWDALAVAICHAFQRGEPTPAHAHPNEQTGGHP